MLFNPSRRKPGGHASVRVVEAVSDMIFRRTLPFPVCPTPEYKHPQQAQQKRKYESKEAPHPSAARRLTLRHGYLASQNKDSHGKNNERECKNPYLAPGKHPGYRLKACRLVRIRPQSVSAYPGKRKRHRQQNSSNPPYAIQNRCGCFDHCRSFNVFSLFHSPALFLIMSILLAQMSHPPPGAFAPVIASTSQSFAVNLRIRLSAWISCRMLPVWNCCQIQCCQFQIVNWLPLVQSASSRRLGIVRALATRPGCFPDLQCI